MLHALSTRLVFELFRIWSLGSSVLFCVTPWCFHRRPRLVLPHSTGHQTSKTSRPALSPPMSRVLVELLGVCLLRYLPFISTACSRLSIDALAGRFDSSSGELAG